MLADEQGLDTPYKLSQATHATLVRLLGQAGYARYDESTARRLHALGKKADAELMFNLRRCGTIQVVRASSAGC